MSVNKKNSKKVTEFRSLFFIHVVVEIVNLGTQRWWEWWRVWVMGVVFEVTIVSLNLEKIIEIPLELLPQSNFIP